MSTATQEQEPQQQQEEPQGQPAAAEQADVEPRQLVRTPSSQIGFGLSARNWEEGLRIARTLANSALVPKAYQGKPEDVVVAMQYGAEIGLPPMAALQSIAVINGKPGVYGDGFLGVIMSKPAYQKHLEHYELADGTRVRSLREEHYKDDDTKAVSIFWRKGNPDPFVAEFSIGDAKRAKLWGKEGPWSTYPARQLKWRARGFAGRDGFAGELRGVKMAEELIDTPEDDISVETIPLAEPVRRSEKNAGAGTTPAAVAPAAPQPELTNEIPESSQPTTPAPRSNGGKAVASTTKAATPKKSAFPQTAPTVTTKGVRITSTAPVEPKGVDRFYEVRATLPGKPPTEFIFFTDDEGVYRQAASCEGSDSSFDVTWHGSKKHDGSACKKLEAIAASN